VVGGWATTRSAESEIERDAFLWMTTETQGQQEWAEAGCSRMKLCGKWGAPAQRAKREKAVRHARRGRHRKLTGFSIESYMFYIVFFCATDEINGREEKKEGSSPGAEALRIRQSTEKGGGGANGTETKVE
jgi:hypothetical protein